MNVCACMNVCMYVCTNECMYVYVYVYVCMYTLYEVYVWVGVRVWMVHV